MSLNGYSLESTDKALDALASHAFLVRCAVGDVSFRRWLIDLCSAEGMFFSHKPLDEIGQAIQPLPGQGMGMPACADAPSIGSRLRVVSDNPRPKPPRLPFVSTNTDDDPPPRCA